MNELVVKVVNEAFSAFRVEILKWRAMYEKWELCLEDVWWIKDFEMELCDVSECLECLV